MSVYLDDAMIPWRGKRWCHLYADTLAELLEFADGIALKRSWLQNGDGHGLPHFDVTGSKLDAAVMAGAVHVTPGDGTYRRLRREQTAAEEPQP